MWKIKTGNRCAAFHTKSLRHRCVQPSWQSAWNQIQPHRTSAKKNIHVGTPTTSQAVWNSLCVLSEYCTVAVIMIAHMPLLSSALVLGSQQSASWVSTKTFWFQLSSCCSNVPVREGSKFPESKFDQRMSDDLLVFLTSFLPSQLTLRSFWYQH